MAKKKSWIDEHSDEEFVKTVDVFQVCIGCRHIAQEGYTKGFCQIYSVKPADVAVNEPCEFYEQ